MRDRSFVIEAGVGTEEVVVSDEESGQGDSAGFGYKAGSSLGVEFVSTVKAFNELFEGSEFC